MRALAQHAPVRQSEARGGQAGHLVDGLFQREQAQAARVVSQHAREAAPQARVRRLVMRQSVGTDHGFIELQDARHVVLVHAEVDGAGRLQAAHGLLDGTAQLARDLVQVAARELRMGLGPGDDDAGGAIDQRLLQDGGRGVVRIAVQADRLRFHLLGDARQRLDRASMIGLPHNLVVRDHHRHAQLAADVEGLLQAVHHRVALVAQVRGDAAAARSGRQTSITSCVLAARDGA